MKDANVNYINGKWAASVSGAVYEHVDPADLTHVTGRWPKSTGDDVNHAITAAETALPLWSGLTAPQRGEYLKAALKLMCERVSQIAGIITLENGKTLKESAAEIQSAIKEMDFQINEGLRLGGEIMPVEQNGVFAYSLRRPLGVVAVISPWNFPFNVPCRKITPALMAGNTGVFKPATLTPGVGAEFVRLLDEAGLPPGVLNLVIGSGAVIGDALVSSKTIKAISFTGSTDVGMTIHRQAASNLTRTQLEMGGKNPLVVLADADLPAAADATILAAYACAGQWCASTSRAVVEKKVWGDFVEALLERMQRIVVGRGTDPNVTMGPVCGKRQLEGILQGIQRGLDEKARLVIGGKRLSGSGLAGGCFVEPTLFADVTPDMFLAQEEIFGPVLSVMAVEDFEQAVEVANQVKFGLSSSIFTRDLGKALTFVERTEVGLTHVNMPTAFKEPQLSFGGVKWSGSGLPEAGHSGVEFFTEHRVAYIKYR
jgi:alpha-ketoglutaric semialdehyde dehydrogenase